jgi:dTMP kinase
MHTYNGLLIALEGIDGSGKSTLAKLIAEQLSKEYPVLLTKEPGGTPLGVELRTILQQRAVHACPLAEYLLFAADRAEHFEQRVIPALTSGKLVISDRMADSSLVYQGFARGLDITMIQQVNAWAMQQHKPDVTIFVDVPLTVACKRWALRNEALSAFELEHDYFMDRVSSGFHALYKDRADVILIDGTQTPDVMCTMTIERLAPWINRYAQQASTTGAALAG